MIRIYFLLLIIIPALEVGLLILSGNTLGIWPTVFLIILTGIVGAWLARKQGMKTLQAAQQEMNLGMVPGEAILDGLCILVGGVVLLTPGFITDTIGFLLLIPPSRKIVKAWMKKGIQRMINNGQFTIIRR